jgi:hypothetical protein
MSSKKKIFKLEDITDFSLFVPRSRSGLMREYPDIGKSEYLKKMRNTKLLFCWYLGCEGSPCFDYYDSTNPKDKMRAIVFAKEKSGIKISKDEWDGILETLTLPAEFNKGIEEFGRFRIGPRVRMNRMIENMLLNFESVINVDINGPEFMETNKEGESLGTKDYDKIRKYTETCLKIENSFKELLDEAEKSFGLSESKAEEFEAGQSFLDLKHESNK